MSRSSLSALALVATLGACNLGKPASLESRGGAGVSLRYEGSCAFLACCSSWAVPVSRGTAGAFACSGQNGGGCSDNRGWFAPAFTCDPSTPGRYRQPHDPPFLACDDRELWLSVPGLTHTGCGEPFVVCHQGARVTAVARDRSAANDSGNKHYEGSLGLLLAIGADPEARDATVSVYPLSDRERIARDPACVAATSAVARAD
jgi:hypothetical protein